MGTFNENGDDKMGNIFYDYVSELIKDYPSLDYEWKNNNQEILFKKKTDQGFDITIGYHNENYLYVNTDKGFHDHFEVIDDDFSETLKSVMGLVRDLLSYKMRIKEILAGNTPRKWILQNYIDGEWKDEHIVGNIFWNYFAKKSERIYYNDVLPSRY